MKKNQQYRTNFCVQYFDDLDATDLVEKFKAKIGESKLKFVPFTEEEASEYDPGFHCWLMGAKKDLSDFALWFHYEIDCCPHSFDEAEFTEFLEPVND